MRPPEDDRALCLHEAAHAVATEVYRPGSLLAVEMDYASGAPTLYGEVFGDEVAAVTSWIEWELSDPDYHVAVRAGREGELIDPVPFWRFDNGDQAQLRRVAGRSARRRAASRAKTLIRTHELAVRRVAAALAERRTMTGDEIREVIAR